MARINDIAHQGAVRTYSSYLLARVSKAFTRV
jgi:hypothetical protein